MWLRRFQVFRVWQWVDNAAAAGDGLMAPSLAMGATAAESCMPPAARVGPMWRCDVCKSQERVPTSTLGTALLCIILGRSAAQRFELNLSLSMFLILLQGASLPVPWTQIAEYIARIDTSVYQYECQPTELPVISQASLQPALQPESESCLPRFGCLSAPPGP